MNKATQTRNIERVSRLIGKGRHMAEVAIKVQHIVQEHAVRIRQFSKERFAIRPAGEVPVRKIEVKAGNLGTQHGWSYKVPVRVVKRRKIEVRYVPSD